MDEQTAAELRSFDLPSIVEAVKSYAVGGARAPTCGIVDNEHVPEDADSERGRELGGAACRRREGAGGAGASTTVPVGHVVVVDSRAHTRGCQWE